ncbi:MAG: dTDP-4-dehydrorhamnose reductase [Betaproteobacteria bacterium]
MLRILLIGGEGQVGWELRRTLAPLGTVHAPLRSDLDLESADSIIRVVRATGAQLIVNAAAYTAVDRAETDVDTATRVNGDAVGILAEEAKRGGAALIHYSTDYVFGGNKAGPYTETDEPDPINVYGRTKLLGEKRIRDVNPPHLIFRASWVYGARGRNFLLTIQKLARERPVLKVVDDQTGCPTWCRLIAEATAQVLTKSATAQGLDPAWFQENGGLYHLAAQGSATWYEFARAILENQEKQARVTAISSAQYPTPARRPRNSALDSSKIQRQLGIELPGWRVGLALCTEASDVKAGPDK